MIALIIILSVLGAILIAAALLFCFGNASIRIVAQDELRVIVSICGFRFTVYPDKKNKPKKIKNLAKCRNPERILKREMRRQQRAEEKARRKKERAAKRAAKRAEKKTGVPQKYCPVPNLKENLEMIVALLKKLYAETKGKVRLRIYKLHISIATDDAAQTAILYGVVVQLVSYLLGYVDQTFAAIERKDGDLIVEPDYAATECRAAIDLACTVKIRRGLFILLNMMDAYDLEKTKTYGKAARREKEQQGKTGFNLKNILTHIRKDHSLWKTNLLSRK